MLFERFGGREDDAEAAYSHEVASCSIYIGILGRRYGRQLPSRFSATHTEYLTAEERGLRVAIWAKDVTDREGHEQAFLDEVRTFHTTGRFETADELARDVERRLRRIAAEDLAPWVKLGALVFRARRIAERAGRTEVIARVRDPAVLARLEAMRPGAFGPRDEPRLTYSGRVRGCRVEDVEVTTTAGSGPELKLSLVTTELVAEPLSEMSVSDGATTYTPQDLTEMGLRRALFGEAVRLSGAYRPPGRDRRPLSATCRAGSVGRGRQAGRPSPVDGGARGEGQRCARCGEPVRLFTGEPLAPGTTYVLRYEHPGDGQVKKSGRLIPVPSMESGIPMCAPTS